MDFMNHLGFWIYPAIFIVKIIQITIASMRIIVMTKGEKLLGSGLAVVEISLWLILAATVISNLHSDPWQMLAYALGSGVGVYFGSTIEGLLALGHSTIHIIVNNEDGTVLADLLREKGFGVTTIPAQGQDEFKRVLLLHVKRKRLKEVTLIINQTCPSAIYTVNDSKTIRNGYGF